MTDNNIIYLYIYLYIYYIVYWSMGPHEFSKPRDTITWGRDQTLKLLSKFRYSDPVPKYKSVIDTVHINLNILRFFPVVLKKS